MSWRKPVTVAELSQILATNLHDNLDSAKKNHTRSRLKGLNRLVLNIYLKYGPIRLSKRYRWVILGGASVSISIRPPTGKKSNVSENINCSISASQNMGMASPETEKTLAA